MKQVGDWALAARILARGPARVKGAIGLALRQEAQLLRKEIVEGLTRQAPGGEAIKPLAATTLATRLLQGFKGTKALLRRGDLRKAITASVEGDEAFVGVLRRTKGAVDVARVHEFGAGPFVVPITPKMRRFLAALFRRVEGGRAPSGGRRGVVVIRVPPRPFLRPAFAEFKVGAQKRFLRRVAQLMARGA